MILPYCLWGFPVLGSTCSHFLQASYIFSACVLLWKKVSKSFVFLTGPAWRSGGEQGTVQSDAGGGALAADGGLWRSGCVTQRA